ncbi:MAG: preprotein translocase subunit YajC [Actinomycetota bacterium]|jgi:preprotein translocase subunit YajC|nr:preprotein translocase subunit YajC [Actinomycetota bacterium]
MFGSFLAATTTSSSGGGLVTLAPLLLMGVVGYFLLIRPQQRRVRAQQTLQRSVEEGDEVLTTSGIYATVLEIDDDEGTVVLEIAPGMHIKAVRGAIAQRITEDEYDEDDDDDAQDEEEDGTRSGFLSDATGDDATP